MLVRENQDMHMGETRLVHAFNIKDTSNMQCIRQDKNNWIQTIVGMQQKKTINASLGYVCSMSCSARQYVFACLRTCVFMLEDNL